jgi:ABC-2 type transport system ATP-binding protein
MCTHVGIINKGKLRFEGTIQELSKKASFCKVQITLDDADKWLSELEQNFKNVNQISNNQITLEIGDKMLIPEFIKNLIEKNASVYEVKILDGLEEWFMTITDEKNNDEK